MAPIVGARNVKQITDNLAAAELHLDAKATAALDEVSAPRPATCPYGAFGAHQRARELDGGDALADLVSDGSDAPLGRA